MTGAGLEHAADAVLELARSAIRHGVEFGAPPRPAAAPAGVLAQPAACFVSLHVGDALRGCIGTTDATRPLAEQIREYAYAAAFRDPRFPALARDELAQLAIEVHVLGPLEPLAFASLAELYALLRPRLDGLQLEQAQRRGLFLPVMWEQLPTPQEFVAQLLRKAGIREPAGLSASRFSARVIADR